MKCSREVIEKKINYKMIKEFMSINGLKNEPSRVLLPEKQIVFRHKTMYTNIITCTYT